MGMVVQHNLPAMNAHRQMGINSNSLSKSLEKLSSGFAINRAADNAAGLAISEKMRGQINGLNQASKNAQDGISLIQTAEGALNETHSILQRMRELSVQSANGTYQDEVDRENIQKEVEALKSEIDRISTSTHYNNIKLLDGSLSAGGTNSVAGKGVANLEVSDAAMNGKVWSVTAAVKGVSKTDAAINSMVDGATNEYTFTYKDDSGQTQTEKISLTFDKKSGKITGSNGSETDAADGSAAEVAKALKNAIGKSEMGKYVDVRVMDAAGDGAANENKLEFTAKTAGTSGASVTGMSMTSTGTSSRITGAVTSPVDKAVFTLDLSSVDVTKLKDGDKITIGDKTVEIFDDSDVGGAGLTAAGTSEAGKLSLTAIKDAATLATNLATAFSGGSQPSQDLGASVGVSKFTVAGVGDTITITLDKGGSTDADGANVQLDKILNGIEYTPAGGAAIKGGYIGSPDSTPVTYKTETTTAAADRSESIDMSKLKAWDPESAADNINDHVLTVDGKKFIMVKDKNLTNDAIDKVKKELGDDVNILRTDAVALTDQDVMRLADRIKEATGTNVSVDPTDTKKLVFKATAGSTSSNGDVGVTFQIGANGSKDQRVTLSVDDMSSKGIGVAKVDVGTREAANAAIDVIDKAINQVSGTRADLGALQNRLEHTINSLDVASENLTASESRIRDVDMAKEMMQFSKSQILSQASQAMLAQANTLPQGVLQLLQ